MRTLRLISFITILLSFWVVGCNDRNPLTNHSKPKEKQEVTGTNYMGERQPCVDYYDPLWCKDPNSLGADINFSIKKDKDGNPVIFNRKDN